MCPSVPLVYQVARACILVYPSLATLLHTASLLPSLPPSLPLPPSPISLYLLPSSSQVSPTPPSRRWYSGDIWCAECGGVLGSGGGWEGAMSSNVQAASVISVRNALYISTHCSLKSPPSGIPFCTLLIWIH